MASWAAGTLQRNSKKAGRVLALVILKHRVEQLTADVTADSGHRVEQLTADVTADSGHRVFQDMKVEG